MSFSPAVFATLQAGASIFQSIGQIQEGETRAQEQEFAAASDLFNVDISRQEARLAQARAKIEIGRKRKAQKALISEQQVLFAVSGVRIDEGSPIIILQDTLEETELDILLLQFNADVESQFLESEARQLKIRAEQRRGVAAQERVAGRIRAGKTLLSAGATFAQKFPKVEKVTGGGGAGATPTRGGGFARLTP